MTHIENDDVLLPCHLLIYNQLLAYRIRMIEVEDSSTLGNLIQFEIRQTDLPKGKTGKGSPTQASRCPLYLITR